MSKKEFKQLAKERGIDVCRYSGNDHTMYVIAPDTAIGQIFMGFIAQYDIPFKVVYQLS